MAPAPELTSLVERRRDGRDAFVPGDELADGIVASRSLAATAEPVNRRLIPTVQTVLGNSDGGHRPAR